MAPIESLGIRPIHMAHAPGQPLSLFIVCFKDLDLFAQPCECRRSGVQLNGEILDAQFLIGFFVFTLFSCSGI